MPSAIFDMLVGAGILTIVEAMSFIIYKQSKDD